MSGINQFLKEKLADIEGKTYISPNIPEKKLANAVKAFSYDGDEGAIIGILDNTMLGSAKEGVMLTGDRIFLKEAFEKPSTFNFSEINDVVYEINVSVNSKGKEKEDKVFKINLSDGSNKEIRHLSLVKLKPLAEILNEAVNKFDDFKEQSQLQPIEELSEKLKIAYLKIIINMAFDNDGEIDSTEFAEILQLTTRLSLVPESRHIIREYMSSIDTLSPVDELVSIIDAHTPDGMHEALHISLVKDLISIQSAVDGGVNSDFPFLEKNRGLFKISDEKIEFAQMAITNDRKILDRGYTDDAITKSVKELGAKAGAVGVPLGAIYLSGSVLGLSAAGMTSGLATLGLGGVLGLSSMATGIGAAVLLGVVAYKGIKHITGTGIEEGDKRRELMLQEIIRQSQKTMNMVIEDINFISQKLTAAISSESVTKEQLSRLAGKLNQYISASKVVSATTEKAEANKARLQCPEIIDLDRLRAVTDDPIKSKYYDLVLKYYAEEVVTEEKDGEEIKRTVLKLIPSSNSKEMHQLGQIFELLDYSSAQSAVKGKIKGIFGNG